MHKDWCGRCCAECETSCELDRSLYCSPDCDYLGENGEMTSGICQMCDAHNAFQEDSAVKREA